MPILDEKFQGRLGVFGRREGTEMSLDGAGDPSRLDFRHASSHLSQKRPGYYLILLRNELRHRSLRSKPSITDSES